jgi:2-hydroxylaminobenzoate mutase
MPNDNPTPSPSASEELLELLGPILARVSELDIKSHASKTELRTLEATLEHEFPHAGAHVQAIGRAIERGIAAGELANRGEPDARFSRVAKPSPASCGLSIDLVSMLGAGLEHTHPTGEITIGFAAHRDGGEGEGEAQASRFEGRAPGWVCLGPGSRHVPRVEGARMNLLYFLPDGAVEWHS